MIVAWLLRCPFRALHVVKMDASPRGAAKRGTPGLSYVSPFGAKQAGSFPAILTLTQQRIDHPAATFVRAAAAVGQHVGMRAAGVFQGVGQDR